MSKRTEQAMTTKRKLLYTAYQMIREEGYPALTIRKLCEKSNVSTGAFYHHYQSKEDLIAQGFMSYDMLLTKELETANDEDPVGMISHIILSLTQYIYDNASGFAKELYISQLAIQDNYIVQKTRPYYQGVLRYIQLAQAKHLMTAAIDAEEITALLLRIARGTILDWCLHDYTYDLMEQARKDLAFILQRFLL